MKAQEIFDNAVTHVFAAAALYLSCQASVLKYLGEHPELGGSVQVLDGKYGPYVKHAKINANLP